MFLRDFLRQKKLRQTQVALEGLKLIFNRKGFENFSESLFQRGELITSQSIWVKRENDLSAVVIKLSIRVIKHSLSH